MLEIQEKFSTEGYESVVDASKGSMLHITEAFDKGNVIGFIAYSYEGDRTIVYDYSDGGDLFLCDGLVRSVMFKSCLKGINTVTFTLSDTSKYKNLHKLRFISADSDTAENIDNFMNGCKNCKKNTDNLST